MKRYAAKLLFQFRVDRNGDSGKRRVCEERIIVIEAASAASALTKAKRRGKKGENKYPNHDGHIVCFEFIGIMDLLHLGIECEADEVWYDIQERLLPMERRGKLVPAEAELHAIRTEQ